MIKISTTLFDLGGNDFLEPYLRREWAEDDDADESIAATSAIRIISNVTDEPDAELERLANEQALPMAVIHCPNIVGTGMNGLMHQLAVRIYKGTYVHIKDNEARVSVVHATDVARAAHIAAGTQGTYTLTDGCDPTFHDLADALAYRIDNKRIITIKPRWARLWYGRQFYTTITTSATEPSTFTEVFQDFTPAEVTNYLRTHVYDENSL